MEDSVSKSFERVAKKMGWMDGGGGLEAAENTLKSIIGKNRHAATSGVRDSRNSAPSESSDDDFDQFLLEKSTPRPKAAFQKPRSALEECSNVVEVSSDDDDGTDFETFLQRVKTPNIKPKKISKTGSEDSLRNFIVDDYLSDDDFIEEKKSFKVPKKINTPATKLPQRKPLAQFNSPVFISDSDNDDDNIVVNSTWRIRHTKSKPLINSENDSPLHYKEPGLPSLPLPPSPSLFSFPSHKAPTTVITPKRTFSAPSMMEATSSSEEEFTSLLERLKKRNIYKEFNKEPVGTVPPPKGLSTPGPKSVCKTPLQEKTPGNSSILKPTVCQTEPRHCSTKRTELCKTPGCFLQSLTNPGSTYGDNFKQNKEELTRQLYQLYNTTVFDNKLPSHMSVTWNKKMRKTAGYCITGQEKSGGNRYARIELSEKVCDSADRLRDTLIHEMCHAATWLINSIRDGHGTMWKLYAQKATLAHPELPMVTRCHSYDIKFRFQYQCNRCQNTIGRHSKSLDTERFVCALCTGKLVLLTPSKPRIPTPFANFVKENYGNVRHQLAGQSHAEVMRKLSADFAFKTKISQS
ncbi:germ cell nuclear acidic protein [Pholidichthys leucotaenia]